MCVYYNHLIDSVTHSSEWMPLVTFPPLDEYEQMSIFPNLIKVW